MDSLAQTPYNAHHQAEGLGAGTIEGESPLGVASDAVGSAESLAGERKGEG